MRSFIILIIFIGLIISHHNWAYFGHFGFDDLHYAKLALQFTKGSLDYTDHYAFRTTIIVLTALSYWLFGFSDFSSSLPAMVVAITTILLVFSILKSKGYIPLIVGLALIVLSKWFLFYADKLMPDIYVALALMAALYAIHEYRYNNERRRTALFASLFVLALLWGFMSKETIALTLPLLVYYTLTDLVQQKNIRFWVYATTGGLVVLGVYFLGVWALTGDFLKRFNAIANNSYLNLCSYDKQPAEFLIQRVTSGFFNLLIQEGMATGFILTVAHLIRQRSLRFLKMDDSFSFWATSALILLLSSNFMSISLTSYSPMCLDPRHYLFLIPVAAIPAAMAFKTLITDKTSSSIAAILMALAAITALKLPENSFWQLYFPLSMLGAAAWVAGGKQWFQPVCLALFVVILAIKPFSMARYARRVNYDGQKEVFIAQVLNNPDSTIIITDDIQKRLGLYYGAFPPNNRHTLLNFEEFQYDSTDLRKKILYLNWHTRFLSNKTDDRDLPLYARNLPSSQKLLYLDTTLNIAIYEMRHFAIPRQTGKLLLQTLNDFEQNALAYWSQEDKNTSAEVKYAGNYAGQALEFSSTFTYPTDSLALDSLDQILIRCHAYVYHPRPTPAQLVISIEREGAPYLWDGVEVNKHIRAFSNWWPITHEVSVPKSDIKENSYIKIYFWNPDKQKTYIDNFSVELIGYNH